MRVRRAVLVSALGIYLVFAVSTGGVTVYSKSWFGGARSVCLVEGLKADIWPVATYSKCGIPFVGFHCSDRASGPVRIEIWDRSRRYARILISRISVRYADGEMRTFAMQWRRSLEPATFDDNSSQGLVTTPVMRLIDQTPNVVDRHLDLSLTLEGHLETVAGGAIPFEITKDFQYRSSVQVFTVWQMLADGG